MKKFLFGALFLMLSVGLFAFTKSNDHKPTQTLLWYSFIDIPGNDPNDPMDYELTGDGGTVEPNCNPGNKRCAVLAEPASSSDNSHPDLEAIEEIRTRE